MNADKQAQGGGEACNCPGEGKLDPALHAPNCPARTAPPSAPVGVMAEAVELLTRWLDTEECECEPYGHSCGRPNLVRVRDDLRALAASLSAPVGVEGVEAALQKWLDWCNEHNEEPEARSGARIAIEALAQQPAAVDEAMVERALAAYLRRQEDGESLYGCVTAALTAALAGQQENGNG